MHRTFLIHVFTYVYPFIFSTSSHPCSFRKQPLYYNSLADQLTFETFNLLARTTCSKYVVTATIMQKNGAGVHSANALWVDPSNDGIVTVKWPTDKKGVEQNNVLLCERIGLEFLVWWTSRGRRKKTKIKMYDFVYDLYQIWCK